MTLFIKLVEMNLSGAISLRKIYATEVFILTNMLKNGDLKNMDNRKMRRFKKAAFKKELKNATFDEFVNVNSEAAFQKFSSIGIGRFGGFFRNSLYSLQVYERNSVKFVGIRRHDQKPSCPWSHRQKIKNFVFGEDAVAVEYMPPENELVDQANMFWIYSSEKISQAYRECNLAKVEK